MEILETGHGFPIAGLTATLKAIKFILKEFWWPTMRKDIIAYIELCHVCAQSKSAHMSPAGLLYPLPVHPRL